MDLDVKPDKIFKLKNDIWDTNSVKGEGMVVPVLGIVSSCHLH